MSSKKKSRPLFEVPVEIGSGGESGWVYRSGAPEKEAPPSSESSEKSIAAESMHVLTLALTTLAHSFSLALRISVVPMKIGMQALRSLTKANEEA
jgi:hypothetical protein